MGISYMHLFVMIVVSIWIKIVKSASKADVLNAFKPIFLTKKIVHYAKANIRNVWLAIKQSVWHVTKVTN
jgi:hypothetical protein